MGWVPRPGELASSPSGPLAPPPHSSFTHNPSNTHSCCPPHSTGPSFTPPWADPGPGCRGSNHSLPRLNFRGASDHKSHHPHRKPPERFVGQHNALPDWWNSECWEGLGGRRAALPHVQLCTGPAQEGGEGGLTPAWPVSHHAESSRPAVWGIPAQRLQRPRRKKPRRWGSRIARAAWPACRLPATLEGVEVFFYWAVGRCPLLKVSVSPALPKHLRPTCGPVPTGPVDELTDQQQGQLAKVNRGSSGARPPTPAFQSALAARAMNQSHARISRLQLSSSVHVLWKHKLFF